MAYADITIRDSNPIKRWLQRRRFSDALTAVSSEGFRGELRILDLGAGSGELVRQMASIGSIEAWVFEPTPSLMAEARENLSNLDRVVFLDNLDSVESAIFDYVFCLEVFEHLPEQQTITAIRQIHRLLKPDGIAVIGVPHELFVPAFVKGVFRMSRRYGDFDASPRNILAAVLGRPPSPRPTSEISPGFAYHFHHLGFDFRTLEHKLQTHFELKQKWFSPFPHLGAFFNSEVYFVCLKSQSSAAADHPQAARP